MPTRPPLALAALLGWALLPACSGGFDAAPYCRAQAQLPDPIDAFLALALLQEP
jgi:hypothetical protein